MIFALGSATVCRAQKDDLYSFDADEFLKKTWEWKGELTLTTTAKHFNTDSVFYPIKFPNKDRTDTIEADLLLSLESRWDWEWSRMIVAGDGEIRRSDLEETDDENTVLREGYWQIKLSESGSIDIGKRLLRWGKGYAFNPVAFLEWPKNPEDPEASREGLWMIQGVWIFGGLSMFENSSATLVYLPVEENLNDDFQTDPDRERFWGLKLYALIGTTDIDLYFLGKDKQDKTDWGIDFAANITSNFEVHGEFAAIYEDESDNTLSLLGLRYLTEKDVTWTVEGYRDSSGLTREESKHLLQSVPLSPVATAKKTLARFQQTRTLNQNYGYVKASIKEPFNWLYFTPSATWLINLDDSSYSTNIQASYVPSNNWAFLLTWQNMAGDTSTQYGENLVRNKTALEVTFSF